jgi:hypothetical protein
VSHVVQHKPHTCLRHESQPCVKTNHYYGVITTTTPHQTYSWNTDRSCIGQPFDIQITHYINTDVYKILKKSSYVLRAVSIIQWNCLHMYVRVVFILSVCVCVQYLEVNYVQIECLSYSVCVPHTDIPAMFLSDSRFSHLGRPTYTYMHTVHVCTGYGITAYWNVHMSTSFRNTHYWYTNIPYALTLF